LVHAGRIESILQDEGIYDIRTENIPFLTTLKNYMQAFESEQKVQLYFFKNHLFLNVKWGTLNPVKYDDPKYGFPVGLKAFGNYSFRLLDIANFLKNTVGVRDKYTVSELKLIINSRLSQPLTDNLATSRLSYTEIDANLEEIAAAVSLKMNTIIADLGFVLHDFRIEGTDFDAITENRIAKITDSIVEAKTYENLGTSYTQKRQLDTLDQAVSNEGGLAGMSANISAGLQIGTMMTGKILQQNNAASTNDIQAKLMQLKDFYDKNLITEQEYTAKKASLLHLL
jgi:membrane protease subunit (stomatin/prohibitin family)